MHGSLSGVVDERGAALHPEYTLPPSTAPSDIAPWTSEPPSSSTSQPASRRLIPKHSLSLLSIRSVSSHSERRPPDIRMVDPVRWPSSSAVGEASPFSLNDSGPESPQFMHIDEDNYRPWPHQPPQQTQPPLTPHTPSTRSEPRKSKSSLFSRFTTRSKSRMRTDSMDSGSQQQQQQPPPVPPVPPLPEHTSFSSLHSYPSTHTFHSVPSTYHYSNDSAASRSTLASSLMTREKGGEKKEGRLVKTFRSVALPKSKDKEEQKNDHQKEKEKDGSGSWAWRDPAMDGELTLDTNLDSMEGIVDPLYGIAVGPRGVHPGVVPNFDPSSPSSALDSSSTSHRSYASQRSSTSHSHSHSQPPSHSHHSQSDHGSYPYTPTYLGPPTSRFPSQSELFSNPFSPPAIPIPPPSSSSSTTSDRQKRTHNHHQPPATPATPWTSPGALTGVSPKTLLPPLNYGSASRLSVNGSIEDSPSWMPPQSWAVHRDGVDKDEAEYSSSEEEAKARAAAAAAASGSGATGPGPSTTAAGAATVRGKSQHHHSSKKRHQHKSVSRAAAAGTGGGEGGGWAPDQVRQVKLRIYQVTGLYHVVTITMSIDVAAMLPKLKEKLGQGERESFRLYLREHSRERLLSPHERPAEIVRKRLEQAGYEPGDIFITNENLNFLVKFIYKSHRLGPAEDEFTFDEPDMIDLTNRGLRTIPVKLHQAAEQIVRLVLSCNPMLEIPLDFIQSCISLRDLHLSNMSIKRVPQSVRHATSLYRLDLSCNRISDLSEAFLDNIPTLRSLNLRSNRLESLPWYFPRISNLSVLDVANNRLKLFPTVVFTIEGLEMLDLSFNQLDEIPNEISRLRCLKELKVAGNRIGRLPGALSELSDLRGLDVRRNKIVDLGPVFGAGAADSSTGGGEGSLEAVYASYNSISALDLAVGTTVQKLDVSHNDITQLTCSAPSSSSPKAPQGLVELKLSYAKLSSIDESTLGSLVSLQTLEVDHNSFTSLPESLGTLKRLSKLVVSDNKLTALPESIGELESLRELDAHNNSLAELPVSIWNCGRLEVLNLTSNLLGNWHDPPLVMRKGSSSSSSYDREQQQFLGVGGSGGGEEGRRNSAVSLAPTMATTTTNSTVTVNAYNMQYLPPLARSLTRLYLGENQLIDEVLHVLMVFKSLKILNLSFNEFQDMPVNFFTALGQLEELYLSGNKLASLPTEDLPKLVHLKRLYLNGNKLQTLPQELGKVKNLTVLDVGSNVLKYNINNWEFDWNWNFNKNLKYLNLSGNKRLQIKSDRSAHHQPPRPAHLHHHDPHHGVQSLAGFTELSQLRVLGLMDVTMTTTGNVWMDIPDENDDRRVRTSSSIVNGMAYGISDALGRNDHLNIVDLVHEFRGQPGEAVFAMFGVAQQARAPWVPSSSMLSSSSSTRAGSVVAEGDNFNPNHLAKFVRDKFVATFVLQLNQLKKDKKEGIEDAMRRTFLRLNQELYENLQGQSVPAGSPGVSGVYGSHFGSMGSIGSLGSGGTGRKMSHVSICSSTTPRQESPGLKHGATGVALYFVGKTLYVANVGDNLAVVSRQGSALLSSRPHKPLDPDEMARIRAAEGWVSLDGRVNDDVDTSRSFGFYNHVPIINARPNITVVELSPADEFVIVANRSLWDFLSYQTAIDIARMEQDPTIASQKLRDLAISYGAEGSIMIMVICVADLFSGELKRKNTSDPTDPSIINIPRKPKPGILDRDIARLDEEVPAPTGHVALVFTDIRNSTHLWEVNPGMPTAMRLHNSLLRRLLRRCGGYEVKTEGDAFMCSFPTALAAVWWCFAVQDQLLHEPWPLEILECEDGKPQWDSQSRLIARGLSVRMGVHWGSPVCERDPITNRMDYFGPVVNRSARISGNAQGGHIMCSADIMREINASVLQTEPDTEFSRWQPQAAIEAIRRMGVFMKQVGEVKLKGLEVPELLTLIYPSHLQGRAEEQPPPAPPTVSASRVQLSWEQVRDLGMVCLRLEALSAGRVFKEPGTESATTEKEDKKEDDKKNEEGEEEAQKDENERYLVIDPKLALAPVNDKSTDEQLMMALDSLSIRIHNACRGIADRLRDPSPEGSTLQQKLKTIFASHNGLDQRTLDALLNSLQG